MRTIEERLAIVSVLMAQARPSPWPTGEQGETRGKRKPRGTRRKGKRRARR